jgi:hypothetical protein
MLESIAVASSEIMLAPSRAIDWNALINNPAWAPEDV